ncbi:MAG TPA: lysophospholipid acyltransferase family protein [Aggregatilineales bacterium]|nr:lysophospholipid acyltransferase family protein [Aggregatilineales bacterium]
MSGNNGTKRRYPPLHVKLYRLATGIIWLLLKLLAKPHVEGRERVPMEGPVIVVTNHLHHLDVAAGETIPRPAWVLAAEKYEHHIFGPILRIAGAIFIDRGEPDRSALRQALNVLEDGNALAIAVEGTRSRTGALAEGKLGTAYLATRSGATVVPLAIWGRRTSSPPGSGSGVRTYISATASRCASRRARHARQSLRSTPRRLWSALRGCFRRSTGASIGTIPRSSGTR